MNRLRWGIALAIAVSVPLTSCRTTARTAEITDLLKKLFYFALQFKG